MEILIIVIFAIVFAVVYKVSNRKKISNYSNTEQKNVQSETREEELDEIEKRREGES